MNRHEKNCTRRVPSFRYVVVAKTSKKSKNCLELDDASVGAGVGEIDTLLQVCVGTKGKGSSHDTTTKEDKPPRSSGKKPCMWVYRFKLT